MAVLATRRSQAESNTYGLPQGSKIRAALRQFFAEQRRAILAWVRTGKVEKKSLTFRELLRIETKDDPATIPAEVPDFEDFGLGTRDLADRMLPLLKLIWDDALNSFASKVGLDPNDWSVDQPRISEAIDAAALAFAESTNATTDLELNDALAKVREAILASRTDKLPIDELTRAINEVFSNASVSRARRIAVTEASRAVHQAKVMQGEASGVVDGWEWLLSSDACPMCQTVARRCPRVRSGEAFAVIGDNPTYSTIRFPPLHPHCQCTIVPVLDIDNQQDWGSTLVQPVPEEEDYPPGEAPTEEL